MPKCSEEFSAIEFEKYNAFQSYLKEEHAAVNKKITFQLAKTFGNQKE